MTIALIRRQITRLMIWMGAVGLLLSATPRMLYGAEEVSGEASSMGEMIVTQLHLDWRVMVVQALGFLITFWILWVTVFRRVGSLLDKRRDNINARLDQIERDHQEAARIREETEQRLAQIEREAQQRLQAATRQAEEEAGVILAKARENAEVEIEQARRAIARERDAAILHLRAEVADLVVGATQRILSESLDETRQRRMVDEMIEQLPGSSS